MTNEGECSFCGAKLWIDPRTGRAYPFDSPSAHWCAEKAAHYDSRTEHIRQGRAELAHHLERHVCDERCRDRAMGAPGEARNPQRPGLTPAPNGTKTAGDAAIYDRPEYRGEA